jgi:hypothetical protein
MKKMTAKAKPGNVIPRKITHIKGETKINRLNSEALKIIRAYKGSFG